jgi:hypothetical protein
MGVRTSSFKELSRGLEVDMPLGLLLKTVVLLGALMCLATMAKALRKIWLMDQAAERRGHPPGEFLLAVRFLVSHARHFGKLLAQKRGFATQADDEQHHRVA